MQAQLNSELRAAGLVCGWDAGDPKCPEWWQLGYLSDLELKRTGVFVTLITRVGIECGFDDSAYLYGSSPSTGWRRLWQSEQNKYTKDGYKPQTIRSIQTSPYSESMDNLVLTLGTQPWCSSNWHDVYYRVFRLGQNPEAEPLVDGEDYAFEGWSIAASLGEDDALVEFRVASVDPALHNRAAIRHYRIKGDKVTRIDPLALSPRDFVEEWLTRDWTKEG